MFCLYTEPIRVRMRSLWNKFEEWTVIFKKSPIFIISQIYFQLNLGENGKCNYSSEEYHEIQKPVESLFNKDFMFSILKDSFWTEVVENAS